MAVLFKKSLSIQPRFLLTFQLKYQNAFTMIKQSSFYGIKGLKLPLDKSDVAASGFFPYRTKKKGKEF